MQQILRAVIRTMNNISVKGQENLDMLLGCIMTLERVVSEMDAKETKQPDGEAAGEIPDEQSDGKGESE